jgi:hypothetical protein
MLSLRSEVQRRVADMGFYSPNKLHIYEKRILNMPIEVLRIIKTQRFLDSMGDLGAMWAEIQKPKVTPVGMGAFELEIGTKNSIL